MKSFLASALRLIRPLLSRAATVDLRGTPEEESLDDEADEEFFFDLRTPSFRLDFLTFTVLPILLDDFEELFFVLDDDSVEEWVVVDREPEP